jgi:hypothetical protein
LGPVRLNVLGRDLLDGVSANCFAFRSGLMRTPPLKGAWLSALVGLSE